MNLSLLPFEKDALKQNISQGAPFFTFPLKNFFVNRKAKTLIPSPKKKKKK